MMLRDNINIVKCGMSDISELVKLEEKYIPGGWSEKAFSEWLKNNNTVIFKAVLESRIIGFTNGSWVLDEGELLNIAVDENFRKFGIAAMLLESLERYFEEKGVNKLFLEVREENIPAINFYIKHKFVKNGLRKNYYRNPNDNGVLMIKRLR